MFAVNGANVENQIEFVEECCSENLRERLGKFDLYASACSKNGEKGFGPTESEFLFCFIHNKRPKRVIQIGCGLSTAVIMMAAEEAGYSPDVLCIDPFANDYLKSLHQLGQIELVPEKAQHVPLESLIDLGEGDFLFIDSTHTVKPGSEVNRLIFEILPRLKSQVYVHFHDIFFPFDYLRGILSDDLFFSNESPLLHAFLIDNPKYTIKASLSMLHYQKTNDFKKCLPHYIPQSNDYGLHTKDRRGHFPSSIYLQVL